MSKSLESNRAAQSKIRRAKQDAQQAFKAERGCARCDERDVRCLDLHHRNPEEKHEVLKRRYGGWAKLSWDDLYSELEKCEVFCANCHRKEHGV